MVGRGTRPPVSDFKLRGEHVPNTGEFTRSAGLRVYDLAALDIDCTALGPMLARPGDPGNGVPLDALDHDVKIDLAYLGSCTGGKMSDFLAFALLVPENRCCYFGPCAHVRLAFLLERGRQNIFEIEVRAWQNAHRYDFAQPACSLRTGLDGRVGSGCDRPPPPPGPQVAQSASNLEWRAPKGARHSFVTPGIPAKRPVSWSNSGSRARLSQVRVTEDLGFDKYPLRESISRLEAIGKRSDAWRNAGRRSPIRRTASSV